MRYIKESEQNLDGEMGFTPEEVADGKLQRFLQSVMEMGCEIHLWTDGCCWVVEYIQDIHAADGIQFVAIDTNSQRIETETENK